MNKYKLYYISFTYSLILCGSSFFFTFLLHYILHITIYWDDIQLDNQYLILIEYLLLLFFFFCRKTFEFYEKWSKTWKIMSQCYKVKFVKIKKNKYILYTRYIKSVRTYLKYIISTCLICQHISSFFKFILSIVSI